MSRVRVREKQKMKTNGFILKLDSDIYSCIYAFHLLPPPP